MSEQTQTVQKTTTNKTRSHKAPVKDSSIKFPHHETATTVIEPASKVAILGYN